MADENNTGDEQFTPDGSMEPLSPQEADTTDYGLMDTGERIQRKDLQQEMRESYLAYALSVIVERALPDVRDGMKPVHRRVIYAMYDGGYRPDRGYNKCSRVVGDVMGKYHPHGDSAIYDTLVRMAQSWSMRNMLVDGQGNFGSPGDDPAAAMRYTECRMAPLAMEMVRDIDKDTVDFVDNYDSTMKEPTLLPVTFPSVLVNNNTGIAVGMASSICSFNLEEVCRTTIELIRNPDHCVADTLKAPDFAGGAKILYDRAKIEEIYRTGRGSFKLYAKYTYDKSNNCIDITEIPMTSTATSESIIEKVIDRVKAGAIREISDIRDETDKSGLKITIDLKRGTDPDKLMQKLFRLTPLQDTVSCNFNILIAGMPRVLGVRELLEEWLAWRTESVRRRVYFILHKKQEKLHLLLGLKRILLDIDKAIEIIRQTEEEAEVVPNLMIGFGIDQVQAEYVAEIKLRNINKEYILKRVQETAALEEEIEDLEDTLKKPARIRKIIVGELEDVRKKYAQPRKTEIIYSHEVEYEEEPEDTPDYPVTLFLSREGYFKKITPQSLRMSGEQKFKEGDGLLRQVEATNNTELMFFTDRQQVYKVRAADFADSKASVLGDYLPTKLGMDEDEKVIDMVLPGDYSGHLLFFFENGKCARVEMKAYATVSNRRKLTGAYSDKSPLTALLHLTEDKELALISTEPRALLLHTSLLSPKTTRATQGVAVMNMKPRYRLQRVCDFADSGIVNLSRYRVRSIPAAGALLREEDQGREQMTLL